jgi:phosphoribosylaminoimidazolecarboxamide formyltransferase/IMP cyclohydrolase
LPQAQAKLILLKNRYGGISLIRAAKNFKDCNCSFGRSIQFTFRFNYNPKRSYNQKTENYWLLKFHVSSHYDAAILTTSIDRNNLQSIADGQVLRYGENPHQKAFLW